MVLESFVSPTCKSALGLDQMSVLKELWQRFMRHSEGINFPGRGPYLSKSGGRDEECGTDRGMKMASQVFRGVDE